jgi:poly(ribitol-phosphate) beta-N-acetylglucosaminyltransferase
MKDISVIITSYNAQNTVKKSILSVLDTIYRSKIEIIVVDDCSNDETPKIIENLVELYDNISFIQLDVNTGSPSTPRNVGIENAEGMFITFLDDDDEMHADNLFEMVRYAKMHNLDCIKGYTRVYNSNEVFDMGKIQCDNSNNIDVMKKILSHQSTRIDIIVNKNFLIDNQIKFDKNYKLGEDTIFYADIFSCNPKIEYYDSFIQHHYKRTDNNNLSSTQNYQDKELSDHIAVWENVEKKLKPINISYYELRLVVAIQNSIKSIILYSNGKISEKCFSKLSKFINENKKYLTNLNLHQRYMEVYNSIIENNYPTFLDASKKRLLITGYDLKFIKPVIKYLEDDYNVQVDEWTGHNEHNEKNSKLSLNWADIIFCEWLLGNSVWYSNNKMNHQKLLIRAHKFEAKREFGNKIDYKKVDGVITVSYYYLELFHNTFKIPREKMILLSNYVETDIYSGIKTEDYQHNLAIVGYIPKWKGLLKGLKIIKMLKESDKEYKLYLIGKDYKEVEWVWNNPEDKSYFLKCEEYIKENNLKDSIIRKGWIEQADMFSNIGYILSVSDIESFHLAPAEGLCDNTLALLLDWTGVEYVYPEDIIFTNIDDIKNIIISTHNDNRLYDKTLTKMKDYIIDEYDIKKFVTKLKSKLTTITLY